MATPYTKRTAIPHAPTDADDLYPDTDGKPMAVSDQHRYWLIWILQVLETYFAEGPGGVCLRRYNDVLCGGAAPAVNISRCSGLFRYRSEVSSDV